VDLPQEIVLRGRKFTGDELKLIIEVVEEFRSSGRTRISEEICKRLDWRQRNGWLKDRACRDVLRRLEALEYLTLPPSLSTSSTRPYTHWSPKSKVLNELPAVIELSGRLRVEVAKGNAKERQWNSIMRSFHYLGFKVAVGRCLKFLIRDEKNLLAAVSLSDAAWAVKARDTVLEQLGIAREDVANNTRFLILPNVKIPHLASQILSLLPSACAPVWEKYYGRKLLLLETFVDQSRFKGTSYRAANWLLVGTTRGYRKNGSIHHNSQAAKTVFLYPLQLEHRRFLASELACQEGAPGK
jgi:Domain of unknown function (DUF4338)